MSYFFDYLYAKVKILRIQRIQILSTGISLLLHNIYNRLSLLKRQFFRERMFIALAWLPKATVQAAIGPLALDLATQALRYVLMLVLVFLPKDDTFFLSKLLIFQY